MLKNVKYRIAPALLAVIFMLAVFSMPANAETKKVVIGGQSFGLKLYCKGVMIINFESFSSSNKEVCPARECGLKTGDTITNIDGTTVKSNEALLSRVRGSKGKTLSVTVLRNNSKLSFSLTPKPNKDKEYCAGMWVRDSCAGIGTISYYDISNNTYAALGHGICDADTGSIMISNHGETLKASITGIDKSKNNNIGTLNGYFTNEIIGTIDKNDSLGLYGKIKGDINKSKLYEVADSSEVKTGNAKIYTTISGTEPKEYDVQITQICDYDKNSNRNFVIKITDKRLINKTGGIVQGMSGSPIVQNGKFVGALTHVFLESCTSGYAVLATNMIDN